MFKRIDHVEIVTDQLDRTVQFYTEVLGFTVKARDRIERSGLGVPIELVYLNPQGLVPALEDGGQKGLSKALDELASDPIRYMKVIGALFPDMVREAIRDEMAEAGMTEEDLREMLRKLESPARDQ